MIALICTGAVFQGNVYGIAIWNGYVHFFLFTAYHVRYLQAAVFQRTRSHQSGKQMLLSPLLAIIKRHAKNSCL